MNARPTHPLETWARQVFRADFASAILHGLYDEREAAEGRVQVGAGPREAGSPKELLITPAGPGPWGRKPLVLAALFRLLIGRPEIGRDLGFTFKELFGELRWPDIPASRREVEDAVHFYHGCSYLAAGGRRMLGGGCRLVIGYMPQVYPVPQCDMSGDEGGEVSFNETLAGALRGGQIIFAGVDFGQLAAAPPPESPPGPRAPIPQEVAAGQPGPRPTVRIEVTPVSRREADSRPKVSARAVGEIAVFIDTGAVASAVLRALNRTAAHHPLPHGAILESGEAIAEHVHREIDRLVPGAVRAAVRQVERHVCGEALYLGHGVIHAAVPEGSYGMRGPRRVWHSPDHLFISLMRAVEAIEFDGWRPGQPGVFVNRRWDDVSKATLTMVVAYWSEVEGKDLGRVDSGRMAKWLKSVGLPKFSRVREVARRRIDERRRAEDALPTYNEHTWLFMVLRPPDENE